MRVNRNSYTTGNPDCEYRGLLLDRERPQAGDGAITIANYV